MMHWIARNLMAARAAALSAAFLAVMLSGPLARAADESLPTGDEVVSKFIEAIGGAEKLAKLETRVATGTIEFPLSHAKGPFTSYEAAPNKIYSLAEIPELGKIESGCDGTVRWEYTAMTGPRIIEGDEKAIADRLGAFDATVHWRNYYDSAKTTAIEDLDGKLHYRVVLTPRSGPPVTAFYDRKTFLQTKAMVTTKGPMGEIPLEITMDEYREVDGVLLPHRQVMRGPGFENVVTLKSIKHNAPIPPGRFDLPDAIRLLRERAAQQAKSPAPAPATAPKKP